MKSILRYGVASLGVGRYGIVSAPPAADGFIFNVKTDNTGTSAANQFTIPLYTGETYDFSVAYDGQVATHNTDTPLTLTFPSGASTYEVEITGTFPRIYFNNTGDKLKLTSITQYGDVNWGNDFGNAFFGCENCTDFGIGLPSNIDNLFLTWTNCFAGTSFPEVNHLTNVNSLVATWWGCSSATSFPAIDKLILVEELFQTWVDCSSATAFPDVNTLTLVYTLGRAWENCSSATSFPAVNNLTLVNEMYATWLNCSAATVFPDINTLTLITSLYQTWFNCSGMTIVPVLPTASTTLADCFQAFYGVGSGMTGTVVELWNVANFPEAYGEDCFLGATGLTNYADIPDSWKGL